LRNKTNERTWSSTRERAMHTVKSKLGTFTFHLADDFLYFCFSFCAFFFFSRFIFFVTLFLSFFFPLISILFYFLFSLCNILMISCFFIFWFYSLTKKKLFWPRYYLAWQLPH
jgi:hypothetical protein